MKTKKVCIHDARSLYLIRIAIAFLIGTGTFVCVDITSAQSLRKRIQGSENRDRPPNDQVEGTIWEYKSTKYKSTLNKGEAVPKLFGRFRIEGNAVFAADNKIKIPPGTDIKEKLKDLAAGKDTELSLFKGLEETRIGEYKKMSNGKVRFDFNDPNGLRGVMIAWPKEDAQGVWLANYTQKEGTKTTGKWLMELRAVKD